LKARQLLRSRYDSNFVLGVFVQVQQADKSAFLAIVECHKPMRFVYRSGSQVDSVWRREGFATLLGKSFPGLSRLERYRRV
jgi:hypothetical protein